jgi:hypothetical protein
MVPPCILISQPFIFAGTTLIHTYQLLHQPLMGVARSNVSTSPDACLSSYMLFILQHYVFRSQVLYADSKHLFLLLC